MISFPKSLNRQRFLDNYWQKMPVILPKALKNANQLISKDRLFELSLDEGIESRLVLENGQEHPWQIFHGPQSQIQLDALEIKTQWSLLVQSVNLWHQDTAKLLETFNFIPQWRLDDIMISYSTESGTVGAHVDQYDVFLIQLSGRRRWTVGKTNANTTELKTSSEIKQIQPFESLIDEVLETGDMLYVPANTAHHGVTIDSGMTLSVGFRSPALSEMLMIFSEQLMLSDLEPYYKDPHLTLEQHSAEISPLSMSKAIQWFNGVTDFDLMKRKAFGQLQTQPKQELLYRTTDCSITELIDSNFKLYRDPAARVAWYQSDQNIICLFINGDCYERPINEKNWIKMLSTEQKITKSGLSGYFLQDNFIILLEIFVESGLFGLK